MDLITEDMRFHEKICELSGNGKLLEIWLALSRQIRIYLTVEQYSYESVEHLVDTHRVILDAIKSGNSRTAQAKLKKNINNGLGRLKTYIME
jgi:DNA-binding GntR family transcriptional regulator